MHVYTHTHIHTHLTQIETNKIFFFLNIFFEKPYTYTTNTLCGTDSNTRMTNYVANYATMITTAIVFSVCTADDEGDTNGVS